MTRRRSLLAAIALVVFAASAARAAPEWAAADAKLSAEYPAKGPGAFAIVARGNRILFARGYGLADVEQNRPLTKDSVVRIASLTKQFTSVAILRLVQDRSLDLDETLARAWPRAPRVWQPITIRQLLSHTSGITDDLTPLYARMTTDMTVDGILALYATRPLVSPPGATWRYSNVNYWILGKAIEIATHESYADFVVHRVLAPAMTHTRYGSHDAIVPGRAAGYEEAPSGGWANARYFSPTLGYSAGGFLSTPADIAAWYAALGSGSIVSPAMLALALTETRTTGGKPTGYGLGWYVSRAGGVTIAHHGGSTFGFESSIYWVPDRGLFAGVFKNTSDKRGEPDDDARMLMHEAMMLRAD